MSSFAVRIAVDTSAAIHALDALHHRQIPFAAALALTRTAQDSQAEVRKQLPSRFSGSKSGLRWIAQGIRVERATKHNLEATVYSRDWFMFFQEEGGTKRPLTALQMAIPHGPIKSLKGAFRPKPTEVLSQPRTFVNRAWNWGGSTTTEFIGQRIGNERYPFAILYILKPQVDVKPAWGMEDTVRDVVAQKFSGEFQQALGEAVQTAR